MNRFSSLTRCVLVGWALAGPTGCGGGLGPRDESAETPVHYRAQLRGLPGRWHATADTDALLLRQGYASGAGLLVLRADSTFAFAGLPDCLATPRGAMGSGRLLPATGQWRVRYRAPRWEVDLAFDPGELYPAGMSVNYFLAVVDSTYQLYTYQGDPDQGQMLTWTTGAGRRPPEPPRR